MTKPAGRVLVIEDEPVLAGLVGEVLRSGGHEVTVASSVEEALGKLSAETFDLAITDYLLNDRTGLELIRESKVLQPALRYLLMSAYLEPELRAEAASEPNLVDVLKKPVNVFELRKRVSGLLIPGEGREDPGC